MAKNKTLPRHLLVFRTSAMGDVAMLPHALRALRTAYPDLRITVATQRIFRPLFEELGVDFLEVDIRGRHHSLAGMLRLAGEARRTGGDALQRIIAEGPAGMFHRHHAPLYTGHFSLVQLLAPLAVGTAGINVFSKEHMGLPFPPGGGKSPAFIKNRRRGSKRL